MKLNKITPLRMAGEIEAQADARKDAADKLQDAYEEAIERKKEEVRAEWIADALYLGERFADKHYTAENKLPELDQLMAVVMKMEDDSGDEDIGRRFRQLVVDTIEPLIEVEAENRVAEEGWWM